MTMQTLKRALLLTSVLAIAGTVLVPHLASAASRPNRIKI